MLDKTMTEAHSVDAAIPNSHNLHSTVTERFQKYTALKEELITTWQLKAAYIIPLVLPTAGVIPNRFHEKLKLLDLRPALHILMQKALTLNTCHIVREVFGTTESKKCLVSTVLGTG
jgi:hypothetical protein